MSRWYFVTEGKPCVPLGSDEVLAAVEDGKVVPLDLLFEEGSERWQPARDVEEFREAFKAAWDDEEQQRKWVLLRKKPEAQGQGYLQSGPFSTKELQGKIKSGEVDYTDFVWKEGMKSWKKVVESSRFSDYFEKIDAEILEEVTISQIDIQPEVPGEELLKNVMQAEPPQLDSFADEVTEDIPPIEAAGPDLTKEEPPPMEEEEDQEEGPISPEKEAFLREREERHQEKEASTPDDDGTPVVVKTTTLKDEVKEALPKALPSLPVGLFMTLVAFIFLATGAWLVYSSLPEKEEGESAAPQVQVQAQQPKAEVPQQPETQAPPPPVESANQPPQPEVSPEQQQAQQQAQQLTQPPPKPKPPPPPKTWPRVEATYLKTRTSNLSGAKAQISFETDASHHFPVDITLVGRAGEILKRTSYWRRWSLRTGPGQERIVSLPGLGLGEGTYRLEARIGEKLFSRTQFFMGKRGSGFNGDLASHRKRISVYHQRERVLLFKTAGRLHDLAKEFETQAQRLSKNRKGWNKFFRAWNKNLKRARVANLRITPSRARNYVFPQDWMDMKTTYTDLDKEVRKIHAKMNGKTRPQLSTVRQLRGQLSRQAQKAASYSLFP